MEKKIKTLRLKNKKSVVICSSILCTTMLFSACSKEKYADASSSMDDGQSEISMTSTNKDFDIYESSTTLEETDNTEIFESSFSDNIETQSTENSEEYSDLKWEASIDCENFSTYLKVKYNINYLGFYTWYGNDPIIEKYLAEYCNEHKGTNYERVPLSKVGYLRYLFASDLNYGKGIKSDGEYISELSEYVFSYPLYFRTPLYADPSIFIYLINHGYSLDSIIPLSDISLLGDTYVDTEFPKEKIQSFESYNGSLSTDAATFTYYLQSINAVNTTYDICYEAIDHGEKDYEKYLMKVNKMNQVFHEHFLNTYGIDYEFHVDQPLDESFIDDVLIPAFGEDKVKEAEENIKRLEEEARAKQSEAPEKESQNVRSR